MNIVISTQGRTAIYEQITAQMKGAILSGEVTVGEALPSIRSLASDLQVSVITTKRVYEELEKEGLIYSVKGKGFFVCNLNQDYLKEKRMVSIEQKLAEVMEECRTAGLSKEDVLSMVSVLYEGEEG